MLSFVVAFTIVCNLNIVEIADVVPVCNLDLNTANCFYVMFKLRNHVGMSIITGMMGLNALTCKPNSHLEPVMELLFYCAAN
jgi:hypothetical protein